MLPLPSLDLCLNMLVATANSSMAQYLECKGPQDIDESDCVHSRYVVVVFTTRIEEEEPSSSLDMIQTHELRYCLEVHILDAILISLSISTRVHSQELYWLLGLYSSYYQLVTEGIACSGSQLFEWQISWYFNPCHAISSSD
jgi:hypothetical protein